jgi:hypothetical protein
MSGHGGGGGGGLGPLGWVIGVIIVLWAVWYVTGGPNNPGADKPFRQAISPVEGGEVYGPEGITPNQDPQPIVPSD